MKYGMLLFLLSISCLMHAAFSLLLLFLPDSTPVHHLFSLVTLPDLAGALPWLRITGLFHLILAVQFSLLTIQAHRKSGSGYFSALPVLAASGSFLLLLALLFPAHWFVSAPGLLILAVTAPVIHERS